MDLGGGHRTGSEEDAFEVSGVDEMGVLAVLLVLPVQDAPLGGITPGSSREAVRIVIEFWGIIDRKACSRYVMTNGG